MRVVACIFVALGFAAGTASILGAEKSEASHLAFVTEYIRELAAVENIRDSAKQELKDADEMEKLSSAIHVNTLFQLELQSEIGMLKAMRLNPPYNDIIPDIASLYDSKITVYKRLTSIVRIILAGAGGPKPNVDYAGLAGEMPELRARLDYIDHTLFHDVTPLVFFTLVDPKPDSQNHVSHMIITKAERARLLKTLADEFGEKMDQKDQNFGVSSATVLRGFLRERKCSDDPWE
jgi:hypothetical protein